MDLSLSPVYEEERRLLLLLLITAWATEDEVTGKDIVATSSSNTFAFQARIQDYVFTSAVHGQ